MDVTTAKWAAARDVLATGCGATVAGANRHTPAPCIQHPTPHIQHTPAPCIQHPTPHIQHTPAPCIQHPTPHIQHTPAPCIQHPTQTYSTHQRPASSTLPHTYSTHQPPASSPLHPRRRRIPAQHTLQDPFFSLVAPPAARFGPARRGLHAPSSRCLLSVSSPRASVSLLGVPPSGWSEGRVRIAVPAAGSVAPKATLLRTD
jgi:hypothetical protein